MSPWSRSGLATLHRDRPPLDYWERGLRAAIARDQAFIAELDELADPALATKPSRADWLSYLVPGGTPAVSPTGNPVDDLVALCQGAAARTVVPALVTPFDLLRSDLFLDPYDEIDWP